MCSPLVIDHVTAALSPADRAAGAGMAPQPEESPSPDSRRCFSRVLDLTHPLTEDFPTASGAQWLELEDFLTFAATGINFKRWHVHEHIGTHIDAPIHFSADGRTVDEIPVDSLVLPLAVVDIRARAAEDVDTMLTPDDVRAWEAAHGDLPPGCCVAVNSGWDRHAAGAHYRNADGDGVMHFPGIHVETALMLIEERSVLGLGIDTLSIDHGPSTEFAAHRAWLPAGRWAVEGLANLDRVPAAGATIVVGVPSVVGASGGPSRIFALA